MDASLSIPKSPQPRPEDVHTFALWLNSLGVNPIDQAKIQSTTGTMESLKKRGIKLTGIKVTSGREWIHFAQGWHHVHEFGDYRLTYDARHYTH
jgi:hypothetical protein